MGSEFFFYVKKKTYLRLEMSQACLPPLAGHVVVVVNTLMSVIVVVVSPGLQVKQEQSQSIPECLNHVQSTKQTMGSSGSKSFS